MKSSRSLVLRREALAELSNGELRKAAGGAPPTFISCPTIHRECPSNPLTDCTIIHETETVTCPTDIC